MIDEFAVINADGRPIDVYRTMNYIKCNEIVDDDSIKHQIVQDLNASLKKITMYSTNYAVAMQGMLQYRFIGPVHLQIPYRSKYTARNKANSLQKIQYYKQKRWNLLM